MAAKLLPYFRWYPSDAESDLTYSSFSSTELGVFHRALNYAWMNDGLPDDDALIARALRLSVRDLREAWPVVRNSFPVDNDGKRRNKRQQTERVQVQSINAKASESAKIRWSRDANALPSQCEGYTRAYEYESVSVFDLELTKKKTFRTDEASFREWWEVWSAVRGTHHENEAAQAYISVAGGIEADVLECTRSYLAGLDNPAKGYNPHKFLFEQVGSGFKARWPVSISGGKRETAVDRMAKKMAERRQL